MVGREEYKLCQEEQDEQGLGKDLGRDYTERLCVSVFIPATKTWVLPESCIS